MFNDRLKELREELEFTQEEFGRKLGVSRTAVSGWETAATEPNISTLIKISELFNVSLDYLLGRTKERYNINTFPANQKLLILDFIKLLCKYNN